MTEMDTSADIDIVWSEHEVAVSIPLAGEVPAARDLIAKADTVAEEPPDAEATAAVLREWRAGQRG